MASLLGNLIFAGQQTLLTTQGNFGSVSLTPNLYSINSGMASTVTPDVAMFQPAFAGALLTVAGVGAGISTLAPILFTRNGPTSVWLNPNTTVITGDLLHAFWHSRIR